GQGLLRPPSRDTRGQRDVIVEGTSRLQQGKNQLTGFLSHLANGGKATDLLHPGGAPAGTPPQAPVAPQAPVETPVAAGPPPVAEQPMAPNVAPANAGADAAAAAAAAQPPAGVPA